jgi:excisionase family DNA binding protein
MEAVIKRTSRKEQEIATKSVFDLGKTAAALSRQKSDVVKIKIRESGEFITVPRKALELLFNILSNMAAGKSISLVPSDSEVSTQQAADMLNVSRPHIVKLLEEGIIPHKKTGSHRRILLEDLIEYDKKLKAERSNSLKKLAKQAQELRLGYE